MVRGRPMPLWPPQNDSRTTTAEGEVAMSIVAPAIDAEIEYRRERITEDYSRARAPRVARDTRGRRLPKSKLTTRAA